MPCEFFQRRRNRRAQNLVCMSIRTINLHSEYGKRKLRALNPHVVECGKVDLGAQGARRSLEIKMVSDHTSIIHVPHKCVDAINYISGFS